MQIENKESTAADNTFSKTVGRATYNVQIYFSKTSKESFDDKIRRLLKYDAATVENADHSSQNHSNVSLPQSSL